MTLIVFVKLGLTYEETLANIENLLISKKEAHRLFMLSRATFFISF